MTALEPAGIQAAEIRSLLDAYLIVAVLVVILVLGALVIALVRREGGTPGVEDPSRGKARVVALATTATVLVLIVLLVLSVTTGRALASLPAEGALQVEIVGHRWWWEVRYPAAKPGDMVRTAYEIHVPVGRVVELRLESTDVIHSFWIPSLGPKRDLLPGKPSTLLLRADRAGVFDGMCAEYCGLQHANMRLRVVAEPPDRFEAWLAHARTASSVPSTASAVRGRDLFTSRQCGACHAIAGTDAFGAVGPDLTHLAGRSRLAMGTIPNDDIALRRWIEDPHADKPGVIMPPAALTPGEVSDLVTYLRSLE